MKHLKKEELEINFFFVLYFFIGQKLRFENGTIELVLNKKVNKTL